MSEASPRSAAPARVASVPHAGPAIDGPRPECVLESARDDAWVWATVEKADVGHCLVPGCAFGPGKKSLKLHRQMTNALSHIYAHHINLMQQHMSPEQISRFAVTV